MTHPLVARILPAGLVALLTLSVVGGVLGFASAGGSGAGDGIDIPQPRIGDRGTYEWQVPVEGFTVPARDFEWQAGGPIPDAQGALRHADIVETLDRAVMMQEGKEITMEIPGRIFVERGTGEAIAHQTSFKHSETMSTSPIPLVPQDADFEVAFSVTAYPQGLACPYVHSLQGTTLPVEGTITVAGECFMGDEDQVELRSVGIEDVQGISAVHYSGSGLDVWFAPGIPYPVKLAAEAEVPTSPEGDSFESVTFTQSLVAFEPGTQPRGPPTPAGTPLEPTFAALKPWGLDDSGIEHPYPLSKAYAMALADPRNTDLKAYVDGHPDAYMAESGYVEFVNNKDLQRVWAFVLTDGHEHMAVSAAEVHTAHEALPSILQGKAVRYDYYVSEGSPSQQYNPEWTGYPTADRVPVLPTLDFAMQRWEQVRTQTAGTAAWGHVVQCGESCERVDAFVAVGSTHVAVDQVPMDGRIPLLSMDMSLFSSALMLDASGQAVMVAEIGVEMGVTTGPGASKGIQGAQAVSPARGRILAAGIWSVGPAEAAGAGLLAVAAGALFYVWPVLKGAPLAGLFSRLQRNQVEEHPQRAMLVMAIEAQPGIHFSELARTTGLANGTLVHHLQVLAKAGVIAPRKLGGYTCYFLGRPDARQVGAVGVVKAPGARKVLEVVRNQPGLSSLEVAQRTGLTPSTVHYHVQRLVAGGLVSGVRDGNAVRLHAMAA